MFTGGGVDAFLRKPAVDVLLHPRVQIRSNLDHLLCGLAKIVATRAN